MSDHASLPAEASTIHEQPPQQHPKNWPPEITYLTDHAYTPAVTAEHISGLSRLTVENDKVPRIPAAQIAHPSPNVEIRLISAAAHPTHPARGQRGLFAARPLPPDSFVLLYLGRVHLNSLSDTDPHSDYDLSLDHALGLSVDSRTAGNEARHANDYRGVAARPNAEFRDCFVKVPSDKRAGGRKWERRVGIFVLPAGKAGLRKAGIAAEEEILVSYGKGFWEARKTIATFRKDEEMLRIADAALEA